MKLRLAAASVMVLALFAGAPGVLAESTGKPWIVAQAEVPQEVQAFLQDTRDPASLGDEELQARFRQARNLAKMKSLDPDTRAQLVAIFNATRQELVNRKAQAQQEKPAAEPEAQPAQKAEEPPPAPEQPKQPAKAEIPDAVQNLLADQRPASELNNEELLQRYRQARSFSSQEALPGNVRRKLGEMARADRAEVVARKQAADAKKQEEQQAKQPEQAPAAVPADVRALLADKRSLKDMSVEELTARVRTARKFYEDENQPGDLRAKLKQIARDSRTEVLSRQGQAEQPPAQQEPAQDKKPVTAAASAEIKALLADNRPLDKISDDELNLRVRAARKYYEDETVPGELRARLKTIARDSRTEALRRQALVQPEPQPGKGNAAQAEAQARQILNDPAPAAKLNDAMLRKRLYAIRDLLALNLVSAQTENALRKKLAAEREVLRVRIAEREGTAPLPTAPAKPGSGNTTVNNNVNVTNIQVILNDRRRSDELDDEELRRRISVYRDAYRDDRYEEDDRDFYEETLERDRELLRRRLIDERSRRAAQLRVKSKNFEFDLGLEFEPSAPKRPRYVFAQEAEDEELEDILAAPPARKLQRKYSIDDIEAEPELREAMPAIEIDNVRFGFNESFVREEEVGNLDRIAEIMEKIIATRPSEVFMIEGHTDAVGGDDYNLKLSRERAAAIKKALSTYYVIPERNLKTVGYGERYLKIPTPDAEQENRRVSVRRVTPLLGLND